MRGFFPHGFFYYKIYMPSRKYNNPPFESPLEEEFFKITAPLLKHGLDIIPQFEVETICKKFRLDFFIKCGDQKIGFELDGPTTHDENSRIYDYWRDSIILIENHVNLICRLNGSGLKKNLNWAILQLVDYIPGCFNLDKIKQHEIFDNIEDEIKNFQLVTETKEDKGRQKIYNYLIKENGGRLNPLIYKYKKQFGDFGYPIEK